MQVVDANGNMYGDDNLEINDINGKPKTTGGGGGSVTSVGTTGLISGGPITTTGTISTSMNTNKLVGRSTAGTGIMEEITVGSGLTLSAGTLTNTATPTPLGYYGAWQDNLIQTAAASNTGYAMIYRVADITPSGISIVNNGSGNPTRITFANTGIYNIQFSSQFQNLANSPQDVTIWLRKNGTDVAGSSGVVGMEARKNPGDPYHTIVSWNYLLSVVAGEYYELVWSTTNHTNVEMHSYAAGSPPPSAASVILTVTQQSGIMAGTGITALNSLTGAAQTFGNDTNVTMVSSGTTHAITWAGTLADSRIASASTWNAKQDALVSGINIKTINSTSLLGSGDIAISSSLTVGTTPIASGTIGRILFQNGSNLLGQDSDLFWDNTNKRLGVGATPNTSTRLDVRSQGALITDVAFRVRNSANTANILTVNGKGQIWANGSGAIGTNTSFGELALNSNTTGTNNTAFGYNAGELNSTGIYNVFLGYGAGQNGTTAASSIFIGTNAGQNSNANNGIFIGQSTSLTGGLGTVSIGYVAGAGTGTHNVSLGYQSGVGMTTGSTNIHIGYRTVTSGITTGNYNTLIGGECVVGAVSNTAVLSDGQGNIAIRKDANNFVGVGYTGIATLGAKLDVRAQGALSTDLAFRVRNSAGTLDIIKAQGDNEINIRANLSLGNFAAGSTRKVYVVRDAETFGIDVAWAGATTTGARITNSGTGANTALLVNSFNGTSNLAIAISNGDISMSGTAGTKIGVTTAQKIGFWNATPIVQPTTAVAAATFVVGAGTAVNTASTFDGYTLSQIVKALRNTGILA
jgi:hypothetical protein